MKVISKNEIVKQRIIAEICTGKYTCGDALPSIMTLAKRFEVSKNTISLALAALHDAGIITLEHGKQTRVTGKLFQRHIEIITNGQAPVGNDIFWGAFSHGIDDELLSRNAISYHHVSFLDSFLYHDAPTPEHLRDGGVILMGAADVDDLKRLSREKIPFCLIYDSPRETEAPLFGVDFVPVMEQIARRLAEAKCTRVAWLGSTSDGVGDGDDGRYDGINRRKQELFHAALKRHGIPVIPELQVSCPHLLSNGYLAMRQLLGAVKEAPDAVFFASDLLAPGGFKALHEAGLKVPDNVLAIGCDGVEIGNYLIPAVSTVEFNRYEIGRSAAAALADHLTYGTPITGAIVRAALTERESFPLYTTALPQRRISPDRTSVR